MQYRTALIARVPRVKCPTHGVRQLEVPWSDRGSRSTALFEMLVTDWLREASFSATAAGRLRSTAASRPWIRAPARRSTPSPWTCGCRTSTRQASIVFDRFHIAKHLGDAVDKVRREENRVLRARGDDRLLRTKYLWLQNGLSINRARRRAFAELRASTLKVARYRGRS